MISVVIPHYKDRVRLMFLLEQLGNQTLAPNFWEVLVVNNDPYLPLALPKDFSVSYKLKLMEEPKPGSYAARNRGISEAQGDIIAFTDSDMLPNPEWLAVAFDKFKSDNKKEIGILTGPVPLYYRYPDNLTPSEIYEKYTGFDFEGYAKEGATGAGNWFSYKSVLEEFGCYREDLKSNGDTELSLRITSKYRIEYLPELENRHPARHSIEDLVLRYRRILGGTYSRRFSSSQLGFLAHTGNFILRRYRFAFKKLFTLTSKESLAILRVCNAINLGAVKEYFHLVRGGETKR